MTFMIHVVYVKNRHVWHMSHHANTAIAITACARWMKLKHVMHVAKPSNHTVD